MTFGATNDEKWITAVGKFMLAFGSIEGSVNELIRQCTTEGLFKVMLPLLLAQRVKIAKELTVERKLSDINKSILLANLEEVVNLSPTRNLIAHNPLGLLYYKDERQVEHGIESEHSQKRISYAELVKQTNRATRLSAALAYCWAAIDVAEMGDKEAKLKRP